MTSSRVRNDVDSIGLHSHYGIPSLSFSRALKFVLFLLSLLKLLLLLRVLLHCYDEQLQRRWLDFWNLFSFGNFGSQSMVVLRPKP